MRVLFPKWNKLTKRKKLFGQPNTYRLLVTWPISRSPPAIASRLRNFFCAQKPQMTRRSIRLSSTRMQPMHIVFPGDNNESGWLVSSSWSVHMLRTAGAASIKFIMIPFFDAIFWSKQIHRIGFITIHLDAPSGYWLRPGFHRVQFTDPVLYSNIFKQLQRAWHRETVCISLRFAPRRCN